MTDLTDAFDQTIVKKLAEVTGAHIDSETASAGTKNLKTLVETRNALVPEPEPIPDPVPETGWEKFKCGASRVWDNETTRVLIKAGGAFAGVAVVTYATIFKDHQVERQAIQQANQKM